MKGKYFDYNATTPADPQVVQAMQPYFTDIFHNPSSFYRSAAEAFGAIEKSRESVAQLLNAKTSEIFFTGSGTESDNLAILGAAQRYKNKGNHIITSQIEHPAVLNTCRYLEKNGFEVTYLPVDKDGLIDLDQLENQIRSKTILISIMHANNEIGVIQDLPQLIRIAHQHNILFHSDAVQSTGKIPMDVAALDIDLLSFSSHKLYGPKGVGVLYKKSLLKIDPIIFGGGHEKGLRSGTENVPGIIGLGEAARMALRDMASEEKQIRQFRDQLQHKLTKAIPDVIINGHLEKRLYNTLNISIRYIEGESMLAMLDQQGFALSSGSACSSKSLDPSHVLLAIGLSHEDAHGSLRISLGKYNTQDDVDALIQALPPIVEKLRSISPFWHKK
jgi:cysteine desulfurase